MPLPTEKTATQTDPLARPIILYGPYKVGKTTLAAELDPNHTLFLATEPGQSGVSIFRQGISTWEEFLTAGNDLAKGGHQFKYVVVDTIDGLARMCEEYVVAGLAKTAGLSGYTHVSDFDWGKGSAAVTREFSVKIAKLCSLGLGVLFISHEKESPIKTNTGLELVAVAPDVGAKGMRKFLLGFVDYILHAEIVESAEGKQHVLRTRQKVVGDVIQVEAGGRVPRSGDPLPELIPLDASEFRAAMERLAS